MAERIRYTAAPLGEVLRDMRNTTEFETLSFLNGDTREAVCEQLNRERRAMALTEEDVRLLSECIDGWGAGDLTGEVSRLRRYATMFEERCAAARTDAARRGRLYVTLGICGGSAVALILGG